MRIFIVLSLSLLIFGSQRAWAQSDSAAPTAERSSQDNRADKKFGLGLGLGSFIAPISGAGFAAHYNLTQSMQFEFSNWTGTWDAKSLLDEVGTSSISKFDVNTQLTQLRLKYFVGNSFYCAAGLGARQIEFDLAAQSGASRIQENLKANTTVFSLAIGNIWTMDSGLYIGGEWLALQMPMSSSVSTSIDTQGTSNADITSLQADANDAADSLAKATTAGIATFQIGWQF